MSSRLDQSLNSGFVLAGHSGVEFFFVLSGFIMAHIHWKDIGHPEAAPRYFYNRFARIFPLFWVVLLLTALGQIALVGQLEPNLSNPSSLIRAILLFPFDGYPPVAVAWTLSHELLFYVILGLALILGRVGLLALGVWWGVCLLLLLLGEPDDYLLVFLFSPYNLLFGFGMVAAKLYQKMPLLVASLCFVGGLLIFMITVLFDETLSQSFRPLFYGLGALGVIGGAARLETMGFLKPNRFLVYFGDASYSTYLIHSSAMAGVAVGFSHAVSNQSFSPISIAAFLLVVGNIAGIGLYHFIERPLLSWMQKSALKRRLKQI